MSNKVRNQNEESDAVLERSSRLYFDDLDLDDNNLDLNDNDSVSDDSDKDRTIDLNKFKYFKEKQKMEEN